MQIAMLTNNYKPFVGGVPISIDRLSRGLRERGNKVTIFAPEYGEIEHDPDVVRYRSREKRLESGMVVPDIFDWTVEEYLKKGGYDLIHVHHPMLIGYTALYLGHKYNIPVAFTYHTRYEQYLHHVVPGTSEGIYRMGGAAVRIHNRIFSNRCDMVFTPTPMIREYLTQNGTKRPVGILPTGLSEEDFIWNKRESVSIRRRYAGDRKFLFCTVSRLEREKNISFLLRSLARLKATTGGSFRLLVIGDGTARAELESEALLLGLENDVIFTGNIPHENLADYYRASDMFLFASKSETQGIVILEAMAAGLPVVAVDASGVCDVVENRLNGWRTSENESVFSDRISELMWNPLELATMGSGALATARGCTASEVAGKAERYYIDILEGRRERDAKRAATKQGDWRFRPVWAKAFGQNDTH